MKPGSRPHSLFPVLAVALLVAGCFGEPEDEDGIDADVERQGYDIQIELLDGTTETRRVTSDPRQSDEDRDRLPDYIELLERTDPRAADTDSDALLDGYDVYLPASDPTASKWRVGGIAMVEQENGTILFLGERGSWAEPRLGNPRDQDTDDDEILDGHEAAGYNVEVNGERRVVTTSVYREDTDGDGLFDGEERDLGTDPTQRDLDGDGVDDRWDLDPWRDLRVVFQPDNVTITNDPAGRSSRNVWFDAQMPGHPYVTTEVGVRAGQSSAPDAWPVATLNPSDDGGDLREGRSTFTFTVTVLSEDGSGAPILVDLFSTTGGHTSLFGRMDARTGYLSITGPGGGADEPWPADGVFEGSHGTGRVSLAPVS